jgi:tetratricopeptide (TPR) repeat protein
MDELSVEFLSTFKAALRHPVSVLRPETARALILQAEREGVLRYEEAAVERILALTRGHPYLTQLTCQLLFDRAFNRSPDETPLITVEDVEAAAPAVLEMGGHALQWIWDGLPPAERIIFSAIAGQAQEGAVFSEDDISAALQEAGIRILVKELNLAPQTLVNWQMLERANGGYRFFVELMRRWVAEHRPLDKVKDELDRMNPLADDLYRAAQGFYQQGRNEQAIAQLRQALEANLNHLKARLLLGTILREEGRPAEAAAEFEEAYRLDEREGRFELLRTLLLQGESLEKAGDEAGALAAYDRALAISPREQTAQTRRAALWEKRGDQALAAGDFEAALEAYRQAGAEAKLAQVKAQQRKLALEQDAQEGQAYETGGEWAKAADVYRRLTELDPDDERWRQALERVEEEQWLAERYAQGEGYVQQGEWARAQKTLAEVIARRPDYRDAAELLALTKRRGAGQPDLARIPRRRLVLVGASGAVLLLLAMAGMWGYAQVQNQAQATRLAATAVAQATAAEEAAVTRVAVAIQGTQLAELQATQTAQAPTATPNPTRTPQPTPTPTPTMDADPTVYDNFNNSAFNGKYNTRLWSGGTAEELRVQQRNGFLEFSSSPSPTGEDRTLDPRRLEQLTLENFNFFESKLRLVDHVGKLAFVKIQLFADLKQKGWWTQCRLNASQNESPYFVCDVYTMFGGNNQEYITKPIVVNYNTWYTVRIHIDPQTGGLDFYLDNQRVDTYMPKDAAELRNAGFTARLGVWQESNSSVLGQVDDVRIGQINASQPIPTSTAAPTPTALPVGELGGLRLTEDYCQVHYSSPDATWSLPYANVDPSKPQATVHDWGCYAKSADGVQVRSLGGIDFDQACVDTYGPGAVARFRDENNPYTWYCVR